MRIVSPSQALALQRSTIRMRAPDGQGQQQVQRLLQVLVEQKHKQVAAIVMLARTTGMRLREAKHLGRINIQEGTKGSRSGTSAARRNVTTKQVNAALHFARRVSPFGSHNLMDRADSYVALLNRSVLPAREILHRHGLKGFHELRAAFACERY